jgi:hypothetical protein
MVWTTVEKHGDILFLARSPRGPWNHEGYVEKHGRSVASIAMEGTRVEISAYVLAGLEFWEEMNPRKEDVNILSGFWGAKGGKDPLWT